MLRKTVHFVLITDITHAFFGFNEIFLKTYLAVSLSFKVLLLLQKATEVCCFLSKSEGIQMGLSDENTLLLEN